MTAIGQGKWEGRGLSLLPSKDPPKLGETSAEGPAETPGSPCTFVPSDSGVMSPELELHLGLLPWPPTWSLSSGGPRGMGAGKEATDSWRTRSRHRDVRVWRSTDVWILGAWGFLILAASHRDCLIFDVPRTLFIASLPVQAADKVSLTRSHEPCRWLRALSGQGPRLRSHLAQDCALQSQLLTWLHSPGELGKSPLVWV